MKFSTAMTAAIIASAATMAHANVPLRVKSDKLDPTAMRAASAIASKGELAHAVDRNLARLAKSMSLDDKPLRIDVSSMLAAMESADSTTSNVYNPMAQSCYVNCYTNCHGSRSWR